MLCNNSIDGRTADSRKEIINSMIVAIAISIKLYMHIYLDHIHHQYCLIWFIYNIFKNNIVINARIYITNFIPINSIYLYWIIFLAEDIWNI